MASEPQPVQRVKVDGLKENRQSNRSRRSVRKQAVPNIEWFVEKVDDPKGQSGRSKGWKWTVQRLKVDISNNQSQYTVGLNIYSS